MNNELTYQEMAGAMNRAARALLVKSAGELWTKALHARDNVRELEVVMVNRLREAGEKLNIASGHEQLTFTISGIEFCRKEILPHLPEGMELAAVRACVRLAASLPGPIETPAELCRYKNEVQLALITMQLEEKPKRELANPVVKNKFSELITWSANFLVRFKALQTEAPIDNWSADQLDEFLESARPVKEAIEAVEVERRRLVET